MAYAIKDGRLAGAKWSPSPHHSERPAWAKVELVVIHCISLPEGQYGTGAPERLFLGTLDCREDPSYADLEGVEVSAHLLIHRDGHVQQFVSFDQQAWHAGASNWCGRERCNQFSIGIELEGTVMDSYSEAQLQSLEDVLLVLLEQYEHLSVNQIVGHQDIAIHRKFDPGPYFDWQRLLTRLSARQSTPL